MRLREKLRELNHLPRKAWTDALVFSAVLALLNLSVGYETPGWFGVNPNPYVIIPVMIGARYGTTAAFYTATWINVLLYLLSFAADPQITPRLFLSGQTFLVLGHYIFGMLSGEVHDFFRRKAERLDFLYEESRSKLRKLDADIRKIAQINNKLQREVLTADNQTFSLDIEVRGLYECLKEDLWIKSLLVFNRMERISQAAIYALPENGNLKRLALLGKDPRLLANLELSRYPLLQSALERNELAAIPEVLGETSAQPEPFLFAMPLLDADNKAFALVVVSQMPFMAFTPRNLRRIDLIARWTAEIIDLRINENPAHYRVLTGPENKRIFNVDFLRAKLRLGHRTAREHDIPTTLVLIHPEGSLEQSALEEAIIKRVRTGDIAAQTDLACSHIAILLPFTAERGGTIFIESTQGMIAARYAHFPKLRYDLIEVGSYTSFDELWKTVIQKLLA